MLVKVRYIKNGTPYGRGYTFRSKIEVYPGDMVELPGGRTGFVTETNASEENIKEFEGKIKEIVELKKSDEREGK